MKDQTHETKSTRNLIARGLVDALAFTTFIAHSADPLPSWNDGPAKKSIFEFVAKVTKPGSPDFVPVPERIATFDNDSTLWCEQPMYFQFLFALDRVKALAPQHPEWVVGSSIKTVYEMRDGQPVLVRLPEINFVDDKTGKPVAINERIGRRPIATFGNSVGDQQMVEWTQGGSGARLLMLVHHDDSVRESAYGAKSQIGTFSDALMAEAKERRWMVVSMKNDWKRIFSFEDNLRPASP